MKRTLQPSFDDEKRFAITNAGWEGELAWRQNILKTSPKQLSVLPDA